MNHEFDPLSAEHLADPFAVLATLDREGAPVFYAPSLDYYVVTRFADVEEVFRDNATYSAANAQLPLVTVVPEAQEILLAGGHKPQPSMVSLDEPAHARLRGPAAKAFTPKRVNGMEPTIRATTKELLDRVDGLDRFDLVETLTFPLPATTIFSLMGVPAERRATSSSSGVASAPVSDGDAPARTSRSRWPPGWPSTAATCAASSPASRPTGATTSRATSSRSTTRRPTT